MRKVLIVEDDKDIVELLKSHLKDLQCEVGVAYDGNTGLRKAQENTYDLLILDIMLPGKEFELLSLLASNPGKSYDRSKILNMVWGYDFDGYEHTVNSHINRLRAKIEPDIQQPTYMLTTWGIGYCFNEEL